MWRAVHSERTDGSGEALEEIWKMVADIKIVRES